MKNKALVVIDIQNDITKNYREIVENLNKAIDWAIEQEMYVIYICQKALRKILCKRYSTNVKNGAVFCALAGLNSLGFLSPGLALQYARPQGVNAARA